MSRQRLIIGVSGVSAPQLACGPAGERSSQAVEIHLVLSAGYARFACFARDSAVVYAERCGLWDGHVLCDLPRNRTR